MKRIASTLLALSLGIATAHASIACHGKFFNPVSDPNWNDGYPITVAGASIGGNSNPPMMHENAICSCPTPYGQMPGVGITYWQPSYLAEVERTGGCFASLGGKELFPNYEELDSGQQISGDMTKGNPGNVFMNVHWYKYPLFAVMDLFSGLACRMVGGFDLADMTEVESSWNVAGWSSITNPIGILFANPVGQVSCIPDAIASSLGYPLDLEFWCGGTTGVVYPLNGMAQASNGPDDTNMHDLYKYMLRDSGVGLLLATIGPWATCHPAYLPQWIKSQYRIDPVGPIPLKGSPIVVGETPFRWDGHPPAVTPVDTSNTFLIWVGTQCCAF
ncbi:hypothetical protein BJI67_15885 (plasmid) [Acidihalobacter aeolianus]|uniref:Conjugal transfer protein TraU n=1 Tax=Acidihalobacter aeolianus TaxID=2792603 RepID=A0A1D8KD10_9GAMM|nr:hypothetical protein BJI67_15885 [Acidihalobacter aeolianus]